MRKMRLLPILALMMGTLVNAQTVRVLKFAEAKEFRMGKTVSKRIVHPEMGARQITLNYSPTVAGHEFSQHVHDNSDDTIVIFAGQADLRQGDSRHRFHAGQSVFVPAGQIHGTVTAADGTEMISFQTPPDMALYTGSRDSSKAGAAPPKGAITPGAVKYVEFAGRDGLFVNPAMGAKRIAAGVPADGSRGRVLARGRRRLGSRGLPPQGIAAGRGRRCGGRKRRGLRAGPSEAAVAKQLRRGGRHHSRAGASEGVTAWA